MPTKLDILATRLVNDSRSKWADLVDLTFSLPEQQFDSVSESLSKHMGESKYSLKRKMNAISYAHSLGYTAEDIKKEGQELALSRYAKKLNADKYEDTTVMKWNLPGSLREVTRKNMAGVAKILGFTTSEQLWDFLNSVLADLVANPESLKHLAGEYKR